MISESLEMVMLMIIIIMMIMMEKLFTCGKLLCVVEEQSWVSGEAGEGDDLMIIKMVIMIIKITMIVMIIVNEYLPTPKSGLHKSEL